MWSERQMANTPSVLGVLMLFKAVRATQLGIRECREQLQSGRENMSTDGSPVSNNTTKLHRAGKQCRQTRKKKKKELTYSSPKWNLNKDWSNSCCLRTRQTLLVSANSDGGLKAKNTLCLCVCWWGPEFRRVWANQAGFCQAERHSTQHIIRCMRQIYSNSIRSWMNTSFIASAHMLHLGEVEAKAQI